MTLLLVSLLRCPGNKVHWLINIGFDRADQCCDFNTALYLNITARRNLYCESPQIPDEISALISAFWTRIICMLPLWYEKSSKLAAFTNSKWSEPLCNGCYCCVLSKIGGWDAAAVWSWSTARAHLFTSRYVGYNPSAFVIRALIKGLLDLLPG